MKAIIKNKNMEKAAMFQFIVGRPQHIQAVVISAQANMDNGQGLWE